uniref:Fe2OG dioxygenase domain-containing protein n=1 Tax=Ditylum brightwellii TaxID=49249 RepID=A0A7S4VWM8_9STRA|mmetsp:Transcript_8739/g.12509  ORF Transcript_8739/g.12509 Transcript_8739/m.12509 type:complete len:429 (+) Transcript_8739:34-1320(+)
MKMRLTTILFFAFLAPHSVTGLHSQYLTHEQLVEFMTNGHVYLKDMLPQLREPLFRVDHHHARNKAARAYERYFLERVGCNETSMRYLARVDEGDGPKALRDCVDLLIKNTDAEHIDDIKPFYQLVDLHEHSKTIAEIAMGEHIASIAADLLQVDRVRLFQTRTFRKVPSKDKTMEELFNHATYMHRDLFMVPIDTNDFFTFWCPLRNVTAEDSVLTYARGSHRDISHFMWYGDGPEEEDDDEEEAPEDRCPKEPKPPMFVFYPLQGEKVTRVPPLQFRKGKKISSRRENKELNKISDEYDMINLQSNRHKIDIYQTINVGDCIAHHGWLEHGATSQRSSSGPREAIALSYVGADGYKLLSSEDRNGEEFLYGDFRDEIMFWQWYYDIKDGELIDHPKLPLIWPPQSKGTEAKSNRTEECDVVGHETN